MFGIGPMELILVAVCALVFVGPQKLPDLMKQLGRFFVQARRYSSDIRNEFNDVVRKAESEIRLEEAEKMRKTIANEIEKAKNEVGGTVLEAEHLDTHSDNEHYHDGCSDEEHHKDHHDCSDTDLHKDHHEDCSDTQHHEPENDNQTHVTEPNQQGDVEDQSQKEQDQKKTDHSTPQNNDTPKGTTPHSPSEQVPPKDPFGDENL